MGGNIPGGNFLGGNFPGGSLLGGNFPSGSFPGTVKIVSFPTKVCPRFSKKFLVLLSFVF